MVPPADAPQGAADKLLEIWRWFWFLLVRNRIAIAAASLVWLIWRSGPQPRRLSYPCQQAAAANLGALAVLIIPALARRRHRTRPGSVLHAFRLAAGSVALAGVLFVLVSAGISVYSEYSQNQISSGVLPPPRTNPPIPTTVAIVQDVGDPMTNTEIESMVRKAVGMAGGLTNIINANDTVVIKPNLVQTLSAPGEGITTDPRIVRAVVRLAQQAGAGRVVIAEGTASSRENEYLERDVTWKAFKDSGYDSNEDHIDDETGVELYDLNDTGGLNQRDPSRVALVHIPQGVLRLDYWVPKMLLKPAAGGFCNVLISVPVLKNHSNGSITLSMKNRVGCAPSDIYHALFAPYEQQMKWSLVHSTGSGFARNVIDGGFFPVPPASTDENTLVQYSIVDLNLVRPQDFAVIDGLVGVTNGPVGNGGPITKASPERRLIIAGKDPVAVDTVGTLAMGYDPVLIPHIAWADQREIGTDNTRAITVTGKHVASVRLDFPDGYGGAPRADSTPPWLDTISLQEDEPVTGTITITGSGTGDNMGLAKAEFSLRPEYTNLIVNGDFEVGDGTGWTPWQAAWGNDYTLDFADVEPGRSGSYCLRLGNASTNGSFGVYQEVSVQPGKTYRVDAYWHGKKLGDMNWFEVLLIDGPFDIAKADSGGEPLVRDGYMYAYDNLIGTGIVGPVGTTFGWLWGHEQDGTSYDYNSRHGERTATGSTMTVVLKAGTTGTGVAAWFDSVSLVETSSEQVVTTLVNPQDPFDIVWNSDTVPLGRYEAKVTVYDAALNEASITRNIDVVPPATPLIGLNPTSLNSTVHYAQVPPDDTFTVANIGVGTLEYTVESSAPWLVVVPQKGSSTGEADIITVHYNTAALPPKTYTATITITDPAAYIKSKTVTVHLVIQTVSPDFDLDGDVDLDDLAHFQVCLSGFGITQPDPTCRDARLDGDTDVDKNDLAILRACLSGEDIPADPDCVNK